MMDKIKQYALPIGIVVVLILTAGLFYVNNKSSQGSSEADQSKQTTKSEKKDDSKKSDKADSKKSTNQESANQSAREVKESDESFVYTAASGDSYTELARHAVGATNSNLSKAQRIAAETFLTQAANEPFLEIGEKVTFNKGDVKDAVKKAEGLSSAEVAAWQTYVPLVDFS